MTTNKFDDSSQLQHNSNYKSKLPNIINGNSKNINNKSNYKILNKNKNFRGPIPGSLYYIINELVSGENTKVFSAVKMNNLSEIDEQKYAVKYYSKDWIISEVLSKLKFSNDKIKKFFDSIKNSVNDYKTIKHENIQEFIDYYDTDEGLYIITEFCEWTLKDYLIIIREPLKFSKIPFECKVRNYIYQILDGIRHLHENHSLSLGGLFNIDDIMVSETKGKDFNSLITTYVKLPHPFLSNFITIIKMYCVDNFPSFYAPEVFERFKQDEILKSIDPKDTFDMGTLLGKINHDMDMWSLGYLLFEIIFENPPFAFEDLNKALSSLNSSFNYLINPYIISNNLLKIINQCLLYNPNKRIQSFYLTEITEEIKKENEIGEDFEKQLKDRSSNKNFLKEEKETFNLSDIVYEKYS